MPETVIDNSAEAVEERNNQTLQNWTVLQKSEEDKVVWVKEFILPKVIQISMTEDRVEDIITIDELYSAVNTALNEATLPADFPEQSGVTREQVEKDFSDFCKTITVKVATADNLSVPDQDIDPGLVYVRLITYNMKQQSFLESWDQSIGFTAGLRSKGYPILPTMNEKRLLFFFLQMINTVSEQSQKIQAATAADMNLFK